ncbi:MAG TPA: sensor domain-containing protein, partial [Acidimicrobiia bacterium]|nr:sensor domain-containing protein [Acidimicrobiia bacterium]
MSTQTLDITTPSESTGNLFVRAFRPLTEARTWTATVHLLLGLALGIAWFTIIVTMFSLSIGLMITLIGIPLLVATINIGRAVGVVERARVRALLGVDLPAFPRRPLSGSFWQRSKQVLGDRAGWRGVAYSLLALPWGIVTFTVAVVVWTVSVAMVGFPIAASFIPENDDGGPYHFADDYVLQGWGRFGYTVGVFLLGILFLVAAPRIVRAAARADLWLTKSILSPSDTDVLSQRVEQLTVSRDASVEGASVELRRIERDLHDGAQQRLVGLAMDLGLARERLAAGGDPERATELVNRAHEEAKQAITELRDLVRGIHPAVLTDRGLDAALSALVARSPVPIELDVVLESRPPAAIEAAAYFVVSEALANIAKHSRARRASVKIRMENRILAIDIFDDGVGGAVEHPGGGLSGL